MANGEADSEDQRIRAAALENVGAILAVRQRAERELLAARDALQTRSEQLARQREWFEATLASIGEAIITTDADARITLLNPVAEEMTGWTNAQARGQLIHDVLRLVNDESRQDIYNPIQNALETGRPIAPGYQTAVIALDGRETAIQNSAAPIRDHTGAIVGAVMVFHDDSRRRRAERALRTSQERLSAIFAQAAVGIAVADLDGRFVEANYKFCEIVGYPLEAVRDMTVFQLTHSDDVEMTRELSRQLIEGERSSVNCEKRYIRADGETVWISSTVTMLRADGGESVRFLGVIQDITERKRAEETRSLLAAVVESSDDAIISKTLDGIITTWNPGAHRLFGYAAQEIIGKSVTLLIPAELHDEEPRILAQLRAGQRVDHYETVRVRKDGSQVPVSITCSPVFDANGAIIGASKIARDISRQKAAENTMRAIDLRKDEFLATLAHELRNPLAPLRHAAEISNSDKATAEQKMWSQRVIDRQVRHMALMLDDLLDLSHLTRGTPELRETMTTLSDILDGALETAQPLITDKKHHLLIDVPDTPVEFAADPRRLAQVVVNLLTNAAKFTPPQGTLRLHAAADEKSVTISVGDTGIGLPPDKLTSIFTMFTQVNSSLDRSERGLGIGLALSRAYVELHGGTIEARSDGLGHGSEFIVRLPRRRLEQYQSHDSPTVRSSAIKRRVLIADDNHDTAETLALLLRMEGHDVAVVNDGRNALASIERLEPDIALLDISMAEFDGLEVARRVREGPSGRKVTLIAVTGWAMDADRERAIEAGFNIHLAKPVEPERLINMLRAGAPI